MAVKIRLQRMGKKGTPFYHIVVADARAPRDGKFIEKIGSYNPNTNPATIELDHAKSVDWLVKGAIPTDTANAILSYKGVLYKKHLNIGVAKGAITQEVADEKFAEWQNQKDEKINAKKANLSSNATDKQKERLAAELKLNADRTKAIADKNAAALKALEPVVEVEEEVEALAETTETETTAELATEEVKAEAETAAPEVTEEKTAE